MVFGFDLICPSQFCQILTNRWRESNPGSLLSYSPSHHQSAMANGRVISAVEFAAIDDQMSKLKSRGFESMFQEHFHPCNLS